MWKRLLVVLLLFSPGHLLAAQRIVIVGDSLSAAYGLESEDGWVSLLWRRLQQQGYDYDVVNASISGDTSAGGRSRLPALLKRHQPAIVIIELGGNDGLRGLPPDELRANLAAMITESQKAGARVLLVGIRLPPNYGPAYTQRFADIYRELAQRYRVPLVPFLLEGIATDRNLMQEDGIHPRREAQPRLLETIWPKLQPLLKKEPASSTQHRTASPPLPSS